MLLQDILKEFLFDCELKKYSKRTMKSYANCSLAFFVYLKNEFDITELEDLAYKHVQQYIKLLSDRGLKETYINSIIKCLRAYFRYCADEQYINRNPMNKIRFQKEELTLILTFTDAEVAKMVNYYGSRKYLDIRNKLIMVFLFDSGIRNNELCNIKVADIHERYITIHGKDKKIRHVPITPTMNRYMIKYNRIK